ncbi:MAG: nucleotidyltransferase domain-containing protein [Anaerolineaceae bacterium]|nr:nucleotidyltransferase domain-containing protein [Anaerolineaceae bacterium]
MEDSLAVREALLARIEVALHQDARIVAAWLTGSYGRKSTDPFSDIDISVVVAEPFAARLCDRPWQVAGQTTLERLEFVSQFGQPGIIHENHNNAPRVGSFTVVIYADSLQEVDWIFLPQGAAERPFHSQLLFDKVDIPVSLPPSKDADVDLAEKLTEVVAFFWMMAFVSGKFIGRKQSLAINEQVNELVKILDYVAKLVGAERPSLPLPLFVDEESQKTAVRQLCQEMQRLAGAVQEAGARFPEHAIDTVKARLTLLK